jgi:hypothetical protein
VISNAEVLVAGVFWKEDPVGLMTDRCLTGDGPERVIIAVPSMVLEGIFYSPLLTDPVL